MLQQKAVQALHHSDQGGEVSVTVQEIKPLQRVAVARLMVRLKPDYWDMHEAVQQLTCCQGWLLEGPGSEPLGWLAARSQPGYRTIEIETLGYDHGGQLAVGEPLTPLMEACERWALMQGMVNLRFVMGSRGLNIHDRWIDDPSAALAGLRNLNREDFDWFVRQGFRPHGILPEIYGSAYHGVLWVKVLKHDLSSLIAGLTGEGTGTV